MSGPQGSPASVWRADTPQAAAGALGAVYDLARTTSLDFTFAPTRLALLVRHGLSVSGPGAAEVDKVLSTLPGLARVPA